MDAKKHLKTVSALAIAGALSIGTASAQQAQSEPLSETNNASASANALRTEQTKRAYHAAGVLMSQLQNAEESQIPQQMVSQAECIGVFPAALKVSLLVGGTQADGLITCRTQGGGWSAPAFFDYSTASVGLQAGAKATDMVLLFNDKELVQDIADGNFKFSANAGVVAGEVGAHAKVETDPGAIVAYRTDQTGAFVGADIEGTYIEADEDAMANIYGAGTNAEQVLTGQVQTPPALQAYNQAVQIFTQGGQAQRAQGQQQQPAQRG